MSEINIIYNIYIRQLFFISCDSLLLFKLLVVVVMVLVLNFFVIFRLFKTNENDIDVILWTVQSEHCLLSLKDCA